MIADDTTGDDRLLDAEALAEQWGVPKSWVFAAARDGRLPCVRLGRYVRFRKSAIEAFLVEQERGVRSVR